MNVFSITIFLFPFSSLFVTPQRMVLAIKLSAGPCVLLLSSVCFLKIPSRFTEAPTT